MFSTDTSEWRKGIILWIAHLTERLGFQRIGSQKHYVVVRDDKSADSKELPDWIKENSSALNTLRFFRFQMSWTNTSLVCPQVLFSHYTGFTIIAFKPTADDLIYPIMLDGLEILLALIKPFHCSIFRIEQLNEWENKINESTSQLYEFKRGKSIDVLAHSSNSLNELMKQYNNLTNERTEFFEFSSQVMDELNSSRRLLEDHKSGWWWGQKGLDHLDDIKQAEFIQQAKWIAGVDDEFQPTPLFFKELYLNAEDQMERCSKKLRELDEEQSRGLRYASDLVHSITAYADVRLQRDVKNLTIWIVVLTGVMAVLTGVMIWQLLM
jgi:hypothetical protein